MSLTNKHKPPTESKHRRIVRQTPETNPEKIKPASALAGPVYSRVVVVSAEEVKRERDRAVHSEVRRHRLPATGLSGRLAFEALFKD
jgi:hypothetical protein